MRFGQWPRPLKLRAMLPCARCFRGMPLRNRNIWQVHTRSGLTAPEEPTLTSARAAPHCWLVIHWAGFWRWTLPQRPPRGGFRPRWVCSCWQRRFSCGACIPFFLPTGVCPCCPCGAACSPCGGCRHGLRRAGPLPPGRGTKPSVRTVICSNWRRRKKGSGRFLAISARRCAPCSYIVMAYARLSIPVFCLNSAARLM